MAFPTGWVSKAALVIDHTKVPADQTAFPVLITEACFAANCPEILTTGNAHAAQSDGGDLRFTTDLAGTTQIGCEIVTWSQNATFSSARAEIWIPCAPLTASDVTIYVWWEGGGGLSQPAAGASFGSQSVWSSNYQAVYHLNEATNAQALDSTVNANHSTANVSTQAAAQIGNGQSFAAASNNYIALPFLQPFGNFTISAWIKATAANYCMILDMRQISGGGPGFGTVFYSDNTGKLKLFNTNVGGESVVSTANVTDNTWHYANGVVLSSHSASVFVDNNAAVSGSFLPDRDGGANSRIARSFDNFYSNQTIDELRVSDTNRAASWITTEYNNQSSPGTFIISGARIASSPDFTQLISDTIALSDSASFEAPTTGVFADTITLSDVAAANFTAAVSTLAADDILAFADSAVANFAVKFPPSLRGNIDYDQIRADARSGPGEKLLTTTGTNTAGHSSVFDSDGNLIDSGSAPGGSGTVTSVAQTVPSGFSVTGSPVTTSGTLAITLDSQAANKFLASPDGSSGSPTFRVIAAGDLPLGSSSAFGAVKVDNTTITAAAGIISAVAPASGLVLLESHTASSSSTLSFNTRNATGQSGNTFQSDYDIYMMELQEFIPATDGARITCQMYTSGAFDSTSGHYAWQAFAMISGGSGANGSTSDTSISLTNGQSNGGNSAWSCTVKLYNPLGTSLRKYLHSEGIGADTSGTRLITFITGGVFTPTTAVTGIQFLCSAGNITSGIARIYGIAK